MQLGIEQSPEVPLSEVLLSLVRETIEEMSSMAGGSVEGAPAGNKNKRTLVREEEPEEEEEVIEEVLNYLLGKGVVL